MRATSLPGNDWDGDERAAVLAELATPQVAQALEPDLLPELEPALGGPAVDRHSSVQVTNPRCSWPWKRSMKRCGRAVASVS